MRIQLLALATCHRCQCVEKKLYELDDRVSNRNIIPDIITARCTCRIDQRTYSNSDHCTEKVSPKYYKHAHYFFNVRVTFLGTKRENHTESCDTVCD